MSKKITVGRVLLILGGAVAIAVFFFGSYIEDRNARQYAYLAPGEYFLKVHAPYERPLDVVSELSVCALPHFFGLFVILACVWLIWRKKRGEGLLYLVNWFFVFVSLVVVQHALGAATISTLSVYRTHFWAAFFIATILTILIHWGLGFLIKSKFVVVLALHLVMALGALVWFVYHFAEMKSLTSPPVGEPIGLYLALGGFFFIAVGVVLLYLAELDNKGRPTPEATEEMSGSERKAFSKIPFGRKGEAVAPAEEPATPMEPVAAEGESSPMETVVGEGQISPMETIADEGEVSPMETIAVEGHVSPMETVAGAEQFEMPTGASPEDSSKMKIVVIEQPPAAEGDPQPDRPGEQAEQQPDAPSRGA
ncbi:MAG: hypothetical protein A2Z34_05005 [Planctomycetes bacterium RBG_16_59_8]|nr:MAG: hypothetical protein A2Z34_05005 [Planctomycetes bacterium RBG_16_59_8]